MSTNDTTGNSTIIRGGGWAGFVPGWESPDQTLHGPTSGVPLSLAPDPEPQPMLVEEPAPAQVA